ncbi:MAG: protein kinase [Planctomycetota bacterium]
MEKQLLLGLLALQNEFVSLGQLKSALAESLESERDFQTCLVDQASILARHQEALEALSEIYLKRHGGNASAALEKLSSVEEARQELSQIISANSPETFGTISWFSDASRTADYSKFTTPASSALPSDDRFRIIEKHAEGGLGVVFLAEDSQLRRKVALKQIKPERADESVYREKFSQEAEITGQLEHPGIVPIYALGTDANGRPYYAMRFIEGESLRDRIKDFHKLLADRKIRFDGPELRELLRRFIDVCNAVAYAHERGVLHRDLKPGNVMLGKFGETLLVDWGLAKTLGSPESEEEVQLEESTHSKQPLSGSDTREGQFLGTAAYAPPEQLEGRINELSERTDVYSLGAILHEILTGKPPVSSASSTSEAVQRIGEVQSRLSTLPGRPKPLVAIAQKALQIDPEDRFLAATNLKIDVQNWLDDSRVAAYAEPIHEALFRWSRQHRTAALSAVITVAAVGVLGLVYGFWSNRYSTLLAEKRVADQQNLRRSVVDSLTEAVNDGDNTLVIERLRELEVQIGSLNIDETLLLAQQLMFNQQLDEALQILESTRFTELEGSQKARWQFLVGDIIYGTDRDEEGAQLLAQAAASGFLPRSENFYVKGMLAETPTEAKALLAMALDSDPRNSFIRERLALTQAVLGNLQEAIETADRGQELHPDNWRYAAVRGLAYALAGDSEQVGPELEELPSIPQATEYARLVRLANSIYSYLASQVGGSKRLGFAEFSDFINGLSSLRSQSAEKDGLARSVPKLAWFMTLQESVALPKNIFAMTMWSTQGKSETFEKLAELLPENKLVNTLACGVLLLKTQDSQDEELMRKLLHRASLARDASESIEGLDDTIALIVSGGLGQREGLINDDPTLRPQQRAWVAEWHEFLKKHATGETPLREDAYFPIWGLLMRNGFAEDALIVAKYQTERADLEPQLLRHWEGRLDLTAERSLSQKLIEDMANDARWYPERAKTQNLDADDSQNESSN